MFISPIEFDLKYPIGKLIGKGTFGSVYQSVSNVVKIISSPSVGKTFESGLNEIDAYSRIDHPCIAKLKNWTIQIHNENQVHIKLALPFGRNVVDEYKSDRLTWEQIVSDILSAVYTLNYIGIAHNDIKVENIIEYHDRIQLIDFGLASNILRYRNGNFIERPLYTVSYRDPAIQPNSISTSEKVEMYSVGVIASKLYTELDNNRLDNYPIFQYISYPPLLDGEKINIINDLVHFPIETRKTIPEIFRDHPSLKATVGRVLETPVVYNKDGPCDDRYIAISIRWMFKMLNQNNAKVQTLFTAVHMLHRCLNIILPNYFKDNEELNQIDLVIVGCIFLAQIASQEPNSNSINELLVHTRNKYTRLQTIKMIVRITEVFKGILNTRTPWDYASCYSDLKLSLLDMMSCQYDPQNIRLGTFDGTDKNVLVSKLYSDLNLPSDNTQLLLLIKFRSMGEMVPGIILPSPVDFIPHPIDYTKIIVDYQEDLFDEESYYDKYEKLYRFTSAVLNYRQQIITNKYLLDILNSTGQGRKLLKLLSDANGRS